MFLDKEEEVNRMKSWIWLAVFGMVALMIAPQTFAQAPAGEEEEEILDIVSGKVAALDLTGNKLSITDTEGKAQDFVLDPNLTTVWDDAADEEKELSDLAVGKDVVVEFRVDETGKKIASWIDIVVPEEKPAAETPAPAVPPAKEPVVE